MDESTQIPLYDIRRQKISLSRAQVAISRPGRSPFNSSTVLDVESDRTKCAQLTMAQCPFPDIQLYHIYIHTYIQIANGSRFSRPLPTYPTYLTPLKVRPHQPTVSHRRETRTLNPRVRKDKTDLSVCLSFSALLLKASYYIVLYYIILYFIVLYHMSCPFSLVQRK